MKANSITITYLSKVSFASLNGADKDVDNINSIKKITLADGSQLPYLSSQALRRALRDRLEEMGEALSLVQPGEKEKSPAVTACDPAQYIDDDLFGYMDAKAGTQRTSAIRVESMVALSPYQGDLDYGTNFMGTKAGGNPNIFESEVHSGVYRGTILIELDRVGKGIKDGKKGYIDDSYIDEATKAARVLKFIDAFRTLWSSGRQSRFLSDISPKFIAAAYMKAKNPVFMEAVELDINGYVDVTALESVVDDYDKFIDQHILAAQAATMKTTDNVSSLKEGFSAIEDWVKNYYGV